MTSEDIHGNLDVVYAPLVDQIANVILLKFGTIGYVGEAEG